MKPNSRKAKDQLTEAERVMLVSRVIDAASRGTGAKLRRVLNTRKEQAEEAKAEEAAKAATKKIALILQLTKSLVNFMPERPEEVTMQDDHSIKGHILCVTNIFLMNARHLIKENADYLTENNNDITNLFDYYINSLFLQCNKSMLEFLQDNQHSLQIDRIQYTIGLFDSVVTINSQDTQRNLEVLYHKCKRGSGVQYTNLSPNAKQDFEQEVKELADTIIKKHLSDMSSSFIDKLSKDLMNKDTFQETCNSLTTNTWEELLKQAKEAERQRLEEEEKARGQNKKPRRKRENRPHTVPEAGVAEVSDQQPPAEVVPEGSGLNTGTVGEGQGGSTESDVDTGSQAAADVDKQPLEGDLPNAGTDASETAADVDKQPLEGDGTDEPGRGVITVRHRMIEEATCYDTPFIPRIRSSSEPPLRGPVGPDIYESDPLHPQEGRTQQR